MNEITLQDIRNKQDELAAMIAAFEVIDRVKANFPRTVQYPDLKDGERHIGTIMHPDGTGHHVILLPGEAIDLTWDKALDWAKGAGGDLPNRVESAMLFANAKDEFSPVWHWTNEQHAYNPVCAWVQSFLIGCQYYGLKSLRHRARAVRRLAI
jgi:hypothetical protein